MARFLALLLLLIASVVPMSAKDAPFQTVVWPETGEPLVQLTFSKFKQTDAGYSQGKEHSFLTEADAQNLTAKPIANLDLTLFVYDKTHARIGDGSILLSSIAPHETVKFEMRVYANGTPVSLSVASKSPGARTVSITVNSVPQGALLKVDGKDAGTTPKIVELGLGKHMLDFSKDGFTTGHFPLEMGPRDTSGGSVSYELGAALRDTVELRDGTVISGDLVSITGMEVQMRIGGTTQTFDRNQIKRILLTPRDPQ